MTNKKIVGIALAAAMAMSMAACGSSDSSSKSDAASKAADSAAASKADEASKAEAASKTETASAAVTDSTANAAAPGDDAGFQEYPIFEDQTVGFMNVSAVYFQPVPMTDGNPSEDYDMHIEADISANENKYCYGVGDWVPYLTVDYKLTNSKGDVAAEGTMMPMSASDGPHYGANIKLKEADTYTVEFQIHSPAEKNYLLHTDAETGPGGTWDDYFKDGNLKIVHEGWDYAPHEW